MKINEAIEKARDNPELRFVRDSNPFQMEKDLDFLLAMSNYREARKLGFFILDEMIEDAEADDWEISEVIHCFFLPDGTQIF